MRAAHAARDQLRPRAAGRGAARPPCRSCRRARPRAPRSRARSCPRCAASPASSASPAAATPRPSWPPRRTSPAARACRLPCRSPTASRAPSGTEETEWQEQVIATSGSTTGSGSSRGRARRVGPVATAVIERHGLLWPCNTYFHAPIFEAAAGGSVLTGVGGDEAFSPTRAGPRVRDVLRGRVRPGPRNLRARRLRARARGRQAGAHPALAARALPVAAARGARAGSSGGSPPRRSASRCAGRAATADAGLAGYMRASASRASRCSPPTTTSRSRIRSTIARFLAALAALPPARRHRSRSQAMDDARRRPAPGRGAAPLDQGALRRRCCGATPAGALAAMGRRGRRPGDRRRRPAAREWASPEPDAQTFTLLQSVWLMRARAAGQLPPAATPSSAAG